MTHRRCHHLHQLSLVFLKLKFEIIAPIPEQNHGAGDIVILDVDRMQTNYFKILELLFIMVLCIDEHVLAVNHLVEAIPLIKH